MGQKLTISCGNAAGQELFAAIREGDTDLVERIIFEDPKLLKTHVFYERNTPLHVASSYGQLQVLSMLLERGALANALNSSGQTPLMLACKYGRSACLQLLLEAGAQVLTFDSSSARTCLHYASRYGHTECVRQILVAAQQREVADSWGFARFVNVRDGHGMTALHMAARLGHSGVVRLLLDSGALVSATTTTTGNGPGHGSSPIHYAARGGSLECVRELLAWGADRGQRDFTGYTAFGIAMKHSNTACAALLNPNAAEPLVWPSPWKFMSESELEPEAKTLLEAALEQANDERNQEMASQVASSKSSSRGGRKRQTLASMLASESVTPAKPKESVKTSSKEDARPAAAAEEASTIDEAVDTGGMGVQEVCCICFEQFCTIEVMECGHQMCATCTLSLCCHSKPNPAIPYSPPPSCPFCRRNIGHLILARPKMKSQEPKEKSKSRRTGRSGGSKHNSKGGGSGGKSSFSGSVLFSGRLSGSSKRLGTSGRIADADWLNRL